jgi:hypothetical protein
MKTAILALSMLMLSACGATQRSHVQATENSGNQTAYFGPKRYSDYTARQMVVSRKELVAKIATRTAPATFY